LPAIKVKLKNIETGCYWLYGGDDKSQVDVKSSSNVKAVFYKGRAKGFLNGKFNKKFVGIRNGKFRDYREISIYPFDDPVTSFKTALEIIGNPDYITISLNKFVKVPG